MAKFGGLGRGLDALLADSQDEQAALDSEKGISNSNLPKGIESDENGTLWVDPNLLIPNPKQPRQEFDPKALEELSASIKEHGIVEPIIIEPTSDDKFYIIAGERRTRASKMAGLSRVPVQIRKYDEQQKLVIALIENVQRADLNPIEEAQAYANLMQMSDLNQEEVAQKVGKKRPTIANAIRLLKLPEDIQKSLSDGQITSGHARAILSVSNPAEQHILFGMIIGSGLSVRQAEEKAAELNNGGRAASKPVKKTAKKDADIADIEQKFIEIFGTKVVLKGNLDKGSIQISYFSKEDLDRLYNIIASQK